jgi:hypothetical protein
MINVSELINDPDFTQPGGVNIRRRKTSVVDFEQSIEESEFNVIGIITIANDLSAELGDYFDEDSEYINVFTYMPLFTTGLGDGKNGANVGQGYLSDIVLWKGKEYKVIKVKNDSEYGFAQNLAISTSIRGG